MIEVMMADDHCRDLLAGHEPVGGVDARQRGGSTAVGLEEHEVIGELDDGTAVRAHAHVPDALRQWRDVTGGGGGAAATVAAFDAGNAGSWSGGRSRR